MTSSGHYNAFLTLNLNHLQLCRKFVQSPFTGFNAMKNISKHWFINLFTFAIPAEVQKVSSNLTRRLQKSRNTYNETNAKLNQRKQDFRLCSARTWIRNLFISVFQSIEILNSEHHVSVRQYREKRRSLQL